MSFGWSNTYLHCFNIRRKEYGIEYEGGMDFEDNVTVGIDISKIKFDAAILFENNKLKTKKFENKSSGFSELINWF